MALGGPGRLGTTFVDRSGTCSATPGVFVTPMTANASRSFGRVSNNNATAKLYVFDKVGAATVASSFIINPGLSYSWDIKTSNTAIQVGSDTANATFEAAEG